MLKFDESVLQDFAEDLYSRARTLVVATAIGWSIIGFLVALPFAARLY